MFNLKLCSIATLYKEEYKMLALERNSYAIYDNILERFLVGSKLLKMQYNHAYTYLIQE